MAHRLGTLLGPFCLIALLSAGCEKAPSTSVPAQEADRRADTAAVAPLSSSAHLEYERNSINVFREVASAVVFVTNKQLQRDPWSRGVSEVKAGQGTGFVWDQQGHIVTNFHVIDKGRSFEVTLQDGKTLPATFVGGDPRKDIAVLKIDLPRNIKNVSLPPANGSVEVGQKAIAIGNPFGFDHTLTVGVISATGRDMLGFGKVTIRDMLQTDAAINPGNSGGPLLDSQGRLIGMNTMITSKSGGSAGVGFAVPVATVRTVVPEIIKYGQVQRAGLGIELVPDSRARENGIKGVVIASVSRGTPAAKAGLQGLRQKRNGQVLLGDVIVGIDAFEVGNYDELYTALDAHKAGDTVSVKIIRGGKKRTINLKLMRLP